MIPDDRLKEIWDELEEAILYGDPTVFNIDEFREQQQIIDELLRLRGWRKRLVEDGERMAQILSDGEGKEDEICCVDYFYARDAVYNHAALMKDIEE